MEFVRVLKDVVGEMEATDIRYALIGGFAMALRGLQRATADLDFILLLQDLERTNEMLTRRGYARVFRSENVSHYQSPCEEWGRIDILHAFRKPSLGMLQRAEMIAIEPGLSLRVATMEDIIGLKVQALSNDPTRAEGDWSDIRLMVGAAREKKRPLDWELIGDYLRLFRLEDHLAGLKTLHGPPD